VGGDTYGTSPGMEALPDLRELQLQTKRKTEATAFLVKPEKIVPSTIKLTGQAGNVVSVASVDKDSVIVPYQIDPRAITEIVQDIERCTNSVDRLAYADVFNAITNLEGSADRTVPEINARLEEKMTQLGPVIERVNNEKLSVAIDRTFGIMMRQGRLPPAPESLQGKPLKVDFVSILTQMQRALGLSQTERVTSFIGNLAAAFPEAADKLNVDEAIDDYADRAGSPPKIIRSDEDVEALREARQQQKHGMEQTAGAMPAARDGADAARLLSEAAQNGGGIQNLIPRHRDAHRPAARRLQGLARTSAVPAISLARDSTGWDLRSHGQRVRRAHLLHEWAQEPGVGHPTRGGCGTAAPVTDEHTHAHADSSPPRGRTIPDT
jgi:hypothetical protein